MAKAAGKRRLKKTSPHEAGNDGRDDDDAPPPKRPRSARLANRQAADDARAAPVATPVSGQTADVARAAPTGDTGSASVSAAVEAPRPAVPAQDRSAESSTWAPGQWEEWVAYRDKETKLNKNRVKKMTVKEMTAAFAKISTKKGWAPHSYDAIRAQKRKRGEADASYRANPLTEDDRARARALYEEHKSWETATKKFNEETGRSMTRFALIQATRRREPAEVAAVEDVQGSASGNLHRWTDQEVQVLKKYTNHAHKDLPSAYRAFVEEMEAAEASYQPRRWIAFLRQLSLVRSAVVEVGKVDVSVGRLWKESQNAEFDALASESSSKTALVDAAARRFGCTRAFARQLYEMRKPPLKWQRDGGATRDGENATSALAEEDRGDAAAAPAGEDAERRPELREDGDDDAELGMSAAPEPQADAPSLTADSAVETQQADAPSLTADSAVETQQEGAPGTGSEAGVETSAAAVLVNLGQPVAATDHLSNDQDSAPAEPAASRGAEEVSTRPPPAASAPASVDTDSPHNEAVEDLSSLVDTDSLDTTAVQEMPEGVERIDTDSARTQVIEEVPEASDTGFAGGVSDQEEEGKTEDAGDADSGDRSVGLSWLGPREFVEQIPWVTEPNTPTTSHHEDEGVRSYSPEMRAYDSSDYELVPEIEQIDETESDAGRSTQRDPRSFQWSFRTAGAQENREDDEGTQDTSTRDGWIDFNARQGIRVNVLRWKRQQWAIGSENFVYEVDELADAAERDMSVPMNQGPAYLRLIQEWTQCLQDGVDFDPGTAFTKPTLTWRRLTEMVIMCYALNDYLPYRVALLRHFGRRVRDPSDFGDCYGDKCCLTVEFGVRGMTWTAGCRHWLFYACEQVYLDGFRSVGDYRLAMALSCALQASNQVRMKRRELEEEKSSGNPARCGFTMDVISVTPPSKFFESYARVLARPYGRMLLDCMVVIIPGAATYGTMTTQFREATRPTTFGTLWESQHGAFLSDAVLCRYDGQDFWLANMSLGKATKFRFVYWLPEERLQTHSRRCGILEECADMPKVQHLSARNPSVMPRHENVIRLIENGAQYKYAKSQLDAAQMKALDVAVKHVGIIPIRGPFGCGKTRLIALIIAVQLEAFPHFRIFVTSETNAAIDEDLRRLVDDGAIHESGILRLGDMPRQAATKYRALLLSEKVEAERAALRTRGVYGHRAEKYLRQFENEQLEKASVVFATTATFGREQFRSHQAQVVINDEGGQTTEVSLVQALRNHTVTLIPIGDPNQLRGRIEMPEGNVERYADGDRRHKLDWSVIHALGYKYEVFPGATLTAQYRSHPQIGRWLMGFYDFEMVQRGPRSANYLKEVIVGLQEDDELPSATENIQVAQGSEVAVMKDRRVALISCDNAGKTTAGGYVRLKDENRVEVLKTVELTLQVARECLKQKMRKTLIVVTPYNLQRTRIEEVLAQYHQDTKDVLDISVHTIDSCQGKEAEVAIVSMVRTDRLGFMAENKSRTLVALSRARDYLFVLAKRAVFEQDPWWEGLYVNAFDADVAAVRVTESAASDEAEERLKDRRRLRELCSP